MSRILPYKQDALRIYLLYEFWELQTNEGHKNYVMQQVTSYSILRGKIFENLIKDSGKFIKKTFPVLVEFTI